MHLKPFSVFVGFLMWCNSQEVLDPPGPLLAHLVLELQVLLGLPKRKTSNNRKPEIEEEEGEGKQKNQLACVSG